MKNNNKISDWPAECAMELVLGECDYCGNCVYSCLEGCWTFYDGDKVGVYIDCDCTCCGTCEDVCPQGVIRIV